MATYDNQLLYTALAEIGVIEKKQLDEAFSLCKEKNLPFDNLLIEKDLISDENLGKVIADLLSLPYIRLVKVSIPEDILHIIPEIVAKKHRIVAFTKDNTGLHLATSRPENKDIQQFVAKKTGDTVSVFYATERDVEQALSLYKKDLQKTFDDLLHEQLAEAGKKPDNEAPIAKIVDLLVMYAHANRASDIHIEPHEHGSLIRFRIDGALHDVLRLPLDLHNQVVSRIKVLSHLRTDEHLSAQDGKMRIQIEQEDLDIRVSIVPIVEGEKVVLRLLSSRSRQFGLADLGMSPEDLEKVKRNFTKPYGMILSTGPTGSGKTTTIYAILKLLNTRDKNIATIEDPVEYDIEGINQIQVNPKTNLTFAEGLRSILRQDPNSIFVGEIRDEETASIAVNSAMTGHLVLSTLHTNDAATSLPRLIDMGIEPYLVASTVNVIIGQRLIRKICEKCRVSSTTPLSDLTRYVSPAIMSKHFGDKKELRLYHGMGCPVCHSTGFSGRIGLFEVLEITEAVRELITSKSNADALQRKAVEQGMKTMLEDGLIKVEQGITTIEEVFFATKE